MGTVLHGEENIDLYYFITSSNLVTLNMTVFPRTKKIDLYTQIKRNLGVI